MTIVGKREVDEWVKKSNHKGCRFKIQRQIKLLTATCKQVEEACEKTEALQQRFFVVLIATHKQDEDPLFSSVSS